MATTEKSCSFSISSHQFKFVDLLYPEAGSFVLGTARILAFSFFAYLNWRNRKLVAMREECQMAYVKGLILPSYSEYFYLLILLNFIAGAFDIFTAFLPGHQRDEINNIILPVEVGAFHCLSEGLAMFLTRFGAGTVAFHRSLMVGLVWGIITAFVFFAEIRLLNGSKQETAVIVFIIYTLALLIFYCCFLVIPERILYRRPALVFYAKFNVIYALFFLGATILMIAHQDWSICSSSATALIFLAVLQPWVIFKTLQTDSQYWQGQGSNPLADAWDEVDISTAASMAANLTEFEVAKRTFPILHFGLIDLEKRLGFVAGGYSRVYFGKYKKKKVALKMMYAMELTPNDVQDFYREAKVLHTLQHKNVVLCRGICVMPPALTLVLEYCMFGSLFDFLYKPRPVDPQNNGQDTVREEAINKMFRLNDQNVFRMTEFLGKMDETLSAGGSFDGGASAGWMNLERDSWLHPSRKDVERDSSLRTPLVSPDEGDERGSMISRDSSVVGKATFNVINKCTSRTGQNDEFGLAQTPSSVSASSPIDLSGNGRLSERNSLFQVMEMMRDSVINFTSGVLRSNSKEGFPNNSYAESLPNSVRYRMICDCIRAIAFLHSKQYLHCDIKSLNFLVCEDFTVKLSDFGETRHFSASPRREGIVPARQWAAPELLAPGATGAAYTIESEMYSLSIVISEITNLCLFGENADKLLSTEWYELLTVDKMRPPLPDDFPEALKGALRDCWDCDKSKRLTSAVLLALFESMLNPA